MLIHVEKLIRRAAERIETLAVADDALAATEYALILGVFVTVAILGTLMFGDTLSDVWSGISTRVSDGSSGVSRGASQTPQVLTSGGQPSRGISLQP